MPPKGKKKFVFETHLSKHHMLNNNAKWCMRQNRQSATKHLSPILETVSRWEL